MSIYIKKRIMVSVTIIIGLVFLYAPVSFAKDDDQDQIILLNDSAAALEDTNPDISKNLTQFADEKEKEWEAKNANQDPPPPLSPEENKRVTEARINLLKKAEVLIQPFYPLIAKSLDTMAVDMNKALEEQELNGGSS